MRKLLFILIYLSLVINLNGLTPVLSQEEVLVGPRPIGLSGAFIATADDIHAITWNPAGIAFLKHNEANISLPLNPIWTRDLKVSVNNFNLTAVFPFKKIYAFGIDWFHLGYSDDPALNWNNKPELEYSEDKVTVAIARQFPYRLKIGANLKYYNMGVFYDGSLERRGNGLGMDIGANWQAITKMKIGLLLNNLFGAHMFYDNGKSRRFMDPAVRLGFAFNFIKDNNMELTFDDMIHLGVEHWFFNMLAIRAGAQKEILNSIEGFGFSSGLGIKYKYFQFDYGFNYKKYFDFSHTMGLTVMYGYHAYLVDILNINVEDMFAAFSKSYAKRDMIYLKVKNKSKTPLKTTIGFLVDKYMDSPTEKVITLNPNVPTEIQLPVVYNNKIMSLKEDGPQNAKIIITYEFEKEKSQDESTKQFTLYSRNSFTWDNLDRLAVFVTPNDEMVKDFTRGIIQKQSQNPLQDEFISDNFQYAMLLYNALSAYGMTYVTDPNTPFAEVSENKNLIDYIAFPAETLKSKTGDCDDLTVLFSSCLENIGIPCAFVDVPGHIFMLFSLNLSVNEAKDIFGSEEYFIDIGGMAWVPLETTMFGKPFTEALKEAREELQRWSGAVDAGTVDKNSLRIVFIQQAWKNYPSGQIDETWKVKLPEINTVNQKNNIDSTKLLEVIDNDYKVLKEKIETYPKVANFNNEIGIKYARVGLYNLAETYFLKAIQLKSDYSSSYNNLGNVYLLNDKIEKAIKLYNEGLKFNPNDKDLNKNLSKAKELLKQ